MERVSVFGTGYLGATHAAGMAELGHEVIGVDTDEAKVARLQAGDLPFFEPGLPELLARHVESGRLRFTTDPAEAASEADVHFIGVGTPQKHGKHAADLTQVHAVVDALAPLLDRPAVILGKSTVPVGTAAQLTMRFQELAPAGAAVELGWNPEFLREGLAVQDTLRPDRIVLGVDPGRPGSVEEVTRRIYAPILDAGTPVIVTDLATAELAKVAANAFLATKISFINAMAEVCDAVGADVRDLADAIGHDARIGRAFLNAGLGFGGGCLPKDLRAFRARASELGVGESLAFLREVESINTRRRGRVVDLARQAVGGRLEGARIAVLGVAFKPDSDDIRDSPALDVAGRLHLEGADVLVYDPRAMANAARSWPTLAFADSVEDAVAGARLVIVATEWQEFREADPGALAKLVVERQVIDARNCLDVDAWCAAGWRYQGLGRHAS
ncbi:MAG: UDP-glucose/GDP-mannose dehydrogenase family protein [Demequinaceae bacterium]|nr:UDP-glucose/GDP-mannose dehydrogenase family protein [Demequinaceae bacterium]